MGAFRDEELRDRTLEIAYRHRIDHIVETGTSDGFSTGILGYYFTKVSSIEIDPEMYEFAKDNLQPFDNIDLHLGNSIDVLDKILIPNNNNYIFFLDSHAQEGRVEGDTKETKQPLRDELRIIKEKNIKPPIIIHDFFVPNFLDGGETSRFSYGPEAQPCRIEYLLEDLNELYGENQFHYYYNVRPSKEDVGVIFIEPILKN